jgi:hypothetical protein
VDPPTGTVTFLLTDIEGSTRLWETAPDAMEEALQRHDRLLSSVIEGHGGVVVTSRGEGDSFFACFGSAVSAVEAAGGCQLRLNAEAWPAGAALQVRMGLHTGEPAVGEASDAIAATLLAGSRPDMRGVAPVARLAASAFELCRAFTGRRSADGILQEGEGSNGTHVRWVFSHIRPDAFHWHAEISRDLGASWFRALDIEARRIRA